jgi:hypothetical protein
MCLERVSKYPQINKKLKIFQNLIDLNVTPKYKMHITRELPN